MKLISENWADEVNYLVEEDPKTGKKNMFIEGIMLQTEVKNKNGRIYPKDIMQKEVARYTKEYVDNNRAYGELGHPEGPTINLERTSHLITSLKEDGNNFIGKAKILSTPMGEIVKNLLQDGAKLGVSSRGMGSLKASTSKGGVQMVQSDFQLATAADIVADPSAPDAFVDGVMEGVEWIWDNGMFKSQKIEEYKHTIARARTHKLQEVKLNVFSDFLKNL
ncbi:primosomal protein [bacterium]|nr:primosomal protein [bacterium]